MAHTMDNEFDEIVAGMEGEFEDTAVAPDYTKLSDFELAKAFTAAKRTVVVHPETEEEIDHQAYYHGLRLESLRRRATGGK